MSDTECPRCASPEPSIYGPECIADDPDDFHRAKEPTVSEPRKFRKKPVVIEAYQTETGETIQTLEGTMTANPGDWIITGVRGERYPCKPDIFEATYEPADKPTVSETCTVGCSPICRLCRRRKLPKGRSAPMEMYGASCNSDCPDYWNTPTPCDLWPNETAEDFGYRVNHHGE